LEEVLELTTIALYTVKSSLVEQLEFFFNKHEVCFGGGDCVFVRLKGKQIKGVSRPLGNMLPVDDRPSLDQQ